MIKSWEERAARGTIVRAVISGTATGDNTLVAAAADGIQTKVLALYLRVAGAVAIRFESGAGGTALTGVMTFNAAGEYLIWPTAMPGFHWIETAANTLLNMELSGTVQVSGILIYYQE